jgi:hypothetical protein
MAPKRKTRSQKDIEDVDLEDKPVPIKKSTKKAKVEPSKAEVEEREDDGPHYFLMKAEPESRIEKGKDVKFSSMLNFDAKWIVEPLRTSQGDQLPSQV